MSSGTATYDMASAPEEAVSTGTFAGAVNRAAQARLEETSVCG